MSLIPLIPESAPFTPEQRSWLNGFLAGILGRAQPLLPEGAPGPPLLVLFGSQSGNAESLSKRIVKEAVVRGFSARAAGMETITPSALGGERNVIVVTSTWGEGDMPDNAAAFWDGLNQNGSSPGLGGVRYAVLSLGDRNYADTFCLAGRKFDERLAELGAERIHPRQDCDVDYDADAGSWTSAALTAFDSEPAAAATSVAASVKAPVLAPGFSRKNPCQAKLIENRLLNAPGSVKDTRHIAFALPGTGMDYEAGDALGVFVRNCPGVVDHVIHTHGLKGEAMVTLDDGPAMTLRDALLNHCEVRHLFGGQPPQPISGQEFVSRLKPLQPRLYSISSSPRVHRGEVHLTVSAVRYDEGGIHHKGVASTFLADRLPPGESTGLFIQKAAHFRLPVDGSVPVIMVGPGTGIAPFRAFLEEREATGATGQNWLFFGDQRRATDFLYEDQLTEWQRNGHLSRLDLAFSRDQQDKLYVQHLMMQNAAEFWAWLERGAHFYVCGDATRMAKDVEVALHQIIQTEGGKTDGEAGDFVRELKKSKRYQRDVY